MGTAGKPYAWVGKTGTQYRYSVLPWPATLGDRQPGNYIFAKQYLSGLWLALYIGECEDLSAGFNLHPKLNEALALGMTHIHAHASSRDRQVRTTEQSDLIRAFNPSCQD